MGGGYATRSPPNFKQRRQTLPKNRIRAVSNFIPAFLVFHDLSKVGDFFQKLNSIGLQKKMKIIVLCSVLHKTGNFLGCNVQRRQRNYKLHFKQAVPKQ